jgi:hydrogenase expression/formation protein HypE
LSVKSFPVGKVAPEILAKVVYSRLGHSNPRLILGPGIGRDFAAIKYDRLLIMTTDPVTGTSRQIGAHSVYINANDIATAGARPVWYMCTILVPPGTNEQELEEIMKGIDTACRKLGITLARGHTEATRSLDRPIVVGFMIGERKGRLLRSEDVRIGDVILMTKTAGIEGTAILASDYEPRLRGIPAKVLSRARAFSSKISILAEAQIISKNRGVRVIHDPTEGGVLNACWELAESAKLGMEVWADKIPIAPETSKICSMLSLDPLKLMSSGCLLAAVAPEHVDQAARRLRKLHVPVSVIGAMTSEKSGRHYSLGGKSLDLKPVTQDELYRLA